MIMMLTHVLCVLCCMASLRSADRYMGGNGNFLDAMAVTALNYFSELSEIVDQDEVGIHLLLRN